MSAHPQSDRVRIELLGAFGVSVGGREVVDTAWPGRRSAELVQLLALADRHRLAREQVIEALWPHLGPEAGAANLRKAAHHARQALCRQDAVVLSGGRVVLFPSCQVETDVECFERAAEVALRSWDRAACAEAASGCTGELLPESLYEEWTQARRDHLRSLHVELLRLSGQCDPTIGADAFAQVTSPLQVAAQRVPALRFDQLRTQALLSALVIFRLLPNGFANRDRREHLAPLLGVLPSALTQEQMTYDLRRLRLHGLIERIAGTHRYQPTDFGLATALLLTRTYTRILRPDLAELLGPDPPASSPLPSAFDKLLAAVDQHARQAHPAA
jgi:hypothetical protein